MAQCAFKNCINSSGNTRNIVLDDLTDVTYHLFPKDPIVRQKWINQMNQDGWEPSHSSALCSLHFNKDYFVIDARGVRQLKPDAIPTEFEFIFKRELDMSEPVSMVCCAYKCGNTYASDPSLTFHTFPLDQPELCAQWLTAMNCSEICGNEAVLCSEHFDASCFVINEDGEKMLIGDAIPSIFVLPEVNESDMMNNELPIESDEATFDDPENEGNSIKFEITEGELALIRKHDETVDALIEEGQRLVELMARRKRLEKKRDDIAYLLDAFLHNGALEKSRLKTMKPLIKEVEDMYQQILVRCLEPCVVINDMQQE